jgi:hypothetical protein
MHCPVIGDYSSRIQINELFDRQSLIITNNFYYATDLSACGEFIIEPE